MKIDASLATKWSPRGDDWAFEMPEGWNQGRSLFGGVSGALAVSLARRVIEPDRPLRSVSFQLLRPTHSGAINGRAELLRSGKSTTFGRASLSQSGAETVNAQLVYAAQREPSMRIDPAPVWTGPKPEDCVPAPTNLPGFPQFLQHVEMRWASGAVPYSGSESAHFQGYFRFHEPVADAEGLVALLDVWPAPSITMLRKPAPASTVTWSAHLVEMPNDWTGYFAFEYETVVGRNGFHTVMGRLHGPDGRLLAWSEQLAAIFD